MVDILVKEGDTVREGQVVAQVEAMKAQHDIKSSLEGTVVKINVEIGDEVDSSHPLIFLK